MSSVNRVILVGRLGKDPEVTMANGVSLAKFSMATDESWKDKSSGEKQQKTEWHNIVAWRKTAELCGAYLRKGSQVYLEGKLQTRSWEKDGTKRYTTEIVADSVVFLGKPAVSEAGGESSAVSDEDIPF